MGSEGTPDMTAASAALSFAATSGNVGQVVQPSTQRLLAPCLGLALVAGAALWIGIGSTLVLLVA
jgi:hypothetical protein